MHLLMHAFARLARLYSEELKALPRGRFALAGVALLAAVLLILAVVVAPSPLGLWSFGLLVDGAGPILVGTWVALQVADLRASRFAQSLYTSPVQQWQVATAQLLVGLTLSLAYVLVTLPFLAVAAAYVEVPASVLRLAAGGGLLMVFSVVLGASMAVLLPARSVSAPVALTVGFLVLALLAIPPAAVLQAEGAQDGSVLMRVLHTSPYVLASDALGLLEENVGVEAREPAHAASILVLQILGLLALLAWSYTREQGPEGWENRPARRGLLAGLAVALLLVVPLAAASTAYSPIEGHAPVGRGWQSYTHNLTLVLVPPGGGVETATVGQHLAGTAADPLHPGEANARDLLVILSLNAEDSLAAFQATLESDPRLVVEPSDVGLGDATETLAVDAIGGHRGGMTVLRVPVSLTPLDPEDLSSNYHQLWVNATYQVDGEDGLRQGAALAALRADVPGIAVKMAAAGAPLLLVTGSAAIRRRLRVGSTR